MARQEDSSHIASTAIADSYYRALPNKEVAHPRYLILFSGVTGSGKSTIARAIEQQLRAVRISNDDIREDIIEKYPAIDSATREKTKLEAVTAILEQLPNEPNGLVVNDASCDRGYDYYNNWATKFGYTILLLRIDLPRKLIEQRIRDRGDKGYRDTARSLDLLDTWWRQWEEFGSLHKADLVVTQRTEIDEIIDAVRSKLECAL